MREALLCNFRLVALTLLCVALSVLAAPAAKISGAVDSKAPFTRERLFAVLDSAGGSGTWMEWNKNGVQDPSMMSVLGPSFKSSNPPQMVWVISERERPLMAVLLAKGAGEVIVFYELSSLDAKPEPLKLNPTPSLGELFADYQQVAPSEFVHMDEPNLKVSVTGKRIRFTYRKVDEKPLRFDKDFAQKNFVEKRSEVRSYMDFFQFEYALMLRAFVQSVHGMFNWQSWHWYMTPWNYKAMIKPEEVEAILSKGAPPEYITIFKTRAVGGEMVEFRVTGNGFYELNVVAP